MITAPKTYDAIVIGGGPGGSSAASVLSSRGYSVLILDKSRFPRFHIGESMVPYLTKAFEDLDVLGDIEPYFMHKLGAEISATDGNTRQIEFNRLHPGQRPLAFNLDRTRSDTVLLEHAVRCGTQVVQEARVSGLLRDETRISGVRYLHNGAAQEATARFVIDASGRAGVIAHSFGFRRHNSRLRHVSIYQFYEDLIPENNPSRIEDAVFSTHEQGWVWCFPVSLERLSVGAVMPAELLTRQEINVVFRQALKRAPRVSNRIRGASPVFGRLQVESNFCYHSETLSGPGFFLVGDAACFVDPMLSGGVYLAAMTGMQAAEAVDRILSGEQEYAAQKFFDNFCKTGYDTYFRLLYAYYLEYRGDLICLLEQLAGGLPFTLQAAAGDYWGQPDQPVLAYLRSKPEWQTFAEPFELVHGCPLYPDAYYKVGDAFHAPA
jgi:FADH2-dependent halogenase